MAPVCRPQDGTASSRLNNQHRNSIRDMPIVFTLATCALVVWAAVYCRRGSVASAALVSMIAAYVLGHSFWNFDLGPLPMTLDRILLVGAATVYAIQRLFGGLPVTPVAGVDWILLALIALVTVSMLLNPLPPSVTTGGSPPGRLLACFLVPAGAYWLMRQARVTERQWLIIVSTFTVMGVYLALTALAEVSQQWWAVFPRYIADPDVGTHFGRARGPALNSASLGSYLAVGFVSSWVLGRHLGGRWRFLPLVLLPLCWLATYFTYTRSVWLAMALCSLMYLLCELQGRWRAMLISGMLAASLLVLTAKWDQLVNLRREGEIGASRHSIQQRTSFLYVSWKMFCDHPIFGVGFGRFYDRKLPYLADRRQTVELDSLRPLQHHNTFLSTLTETGMVGLALLLSLLLAWVRSAYTLARTAALPAWLRCHGVLMLAVLLIYGASAMFHDLTQQPAEQYLLLFVAGLTVGLTRVHCPTPWSAASPCRATASQRQTSWTGLLPPVRPAIVQGR